LTWNLQNIFFRGLSCIFTRSRSILREIKGFTERELLEKTTIDLLYEKIKRQTFADETTRIQHIQHALDVKEHRVCPYCGKPLVLRTAKRTGKQFYGCSGYPQCRYMAK
jgi:hypothetical protein